MVPKRKFKKNEVYRPEVHIKEVKRGIPQVIFVSGRSFRLVEDEEPKKENKIDKVLNQIG